MSCSNYHCSVVRVGSIGVLVEGDSGSGKSSLVMGLLERAAQLNVKAAMVSDDQALLEVHAKTLVAKAPHSISGKIEIRGYGIVSRPAIESTKIDLIACLLPDDQIDRMPHKKSKTVLGIELPFIELPRRHETAGVRIIFEWIADNS